jgi:predicted Zn finger-like uncharacterized protein
MIRLACPGCSATFTVDDDKAGKAGKCSKCQTQFVIPSADTGQLGSTHQKPPSMSAGSGHGTVEIASCPKCQTRLSVAASDIGLEVECPYCKTVFKAAHDGSQATPIPVVSVAGSEPRPKRRSNDDGEDRPRRYRNEDDDDFELADDIDIENDRPRRRQRAVRESQRVIAGVLALVGFLFLVPIHKFVLGYTTTGIIQLVLNWATCGTAAIIQFVEGIIYLTKSDDEFIEMYQVNEKHWF